MPRRFAVAREHLAQLLHLSAAAITHELGCIPDHINVLLHQARPYLRAGGRRMATHFASSPEQRAVIQQFQASSLFVSVLASAVDCPPARLFDELSSRVLMPEEQVAALAQLLNQNWGGLVEQERIR